ncbi:MULTISPECIES: hypothetical protein [Rhizobium]|uniref:AI-2E family transporter n=1 Tax=Rhizobium aouanii TaxID=3118145 RepID=A0ABU8CL67_9HYPH|nr:hypothetical protein [Rhizobium acaciae]MCW1410866.1 hypothetical protein [Rhizobium acaciae]MCW1742835.1 hypothetical protein [Rhizobium acaciae]MCW1750031.1 hypothetical protein [Rhizobium acaciae]
MAPFRARLGRLFQNIRGGSGDTGLASGNKLAKQGDIFFLIILVLVVLGSIALLVWVPGAIVQYILAGLWGLTVGGALLLFLPAKLLITVIGGLLGVGASDFVGLAQVVEKMSTTVAAVAKTINSSGPVQFQQQPIWLFLILVALCCLPAYRTER